MQPAVSCPLCDDDLLRAAAGREAALAAPAWFLGGRTQVLPDSPSAGRLVVEALKTVACVSHSILCAYLTQWILVGPHVRPDAIPLGARLGVAALLLAMTTASVFGGGWQTLGPRRFAAGAAAGLVLYAVVAISQA